MIASTSQVLRTKAPDRLREAATLVVCCRVVLPVIVPAFFYLGI